MFVGRQNELNELQEGYDSGTFQCVVLYGRRRIGKTYFSFYRGQTRYFFYRAGSER